MINPSKFKAPLAVPSRTSVNEQDGFHWKNVKIDVLHSQSADIAQGVDKAADHDNAEVLAIRASCSAMPAVRPRTLCGADLLLSQDLQLLSTARKKARDVPKLGPVCQSQVTVRYVDGKPSRGGLHRSVDQHP